MLCEECHNLTLMSPEQVFSIRKELRLTQVKLAARLNVARETISRWENGVESPLPVYVMMLRELQQSRGTRTSKVEVSNVG